MPADEFLKHHYEALKTCVEIAEPSTESTGGTPTQEYKIWNTANEGLNILLQHNPEFTPLSAVDQELFDRVHKAVYGFPSTQFRQRVMSDLEARLKMV